VTTKVRNLEARWLADFGKRFKGLSKDNVRRLFQHYLIEDALELRGDGTVRLKTARAQSYAQ